MYIIKDAIYYIYNRILKSKDNKIDEIIIKEAVEIYGFRAVYNTGYIKSFKLYSKVNRKVIQKCGILSKRSIDFIYN